MTVHAPATDACPISTAHTGTVPACSTFCPTPRGLDRAPGTPPPSTPQAASQHAVRKPPPGLSACRYSILTLLKRSMSCRQPAAWFPAVFMCGCSPLPCLYSLYAPVCACQSVLRQLDMDTCLQSCNQLDFAILSAKSSPCSCDDTLCTALYHGFAPWHASLHMPESGSMTEGGKQAPSQLQGKLFVDKQVRFIFFEPCKHPTATVC